MWPFYYDDWTFFDQLEILGWSLYGFLLLGIILTTWGVRLLLSWRDGREIAAFTIIAAFPTMLGVLNFAIGWIRIVVTFGVSGGIDPGKIFSWTSEIMAFPVVVGFTMSLVFLALAACALLVNRGSRETPS